VPIRSTGVFVGEAPADAVATVANTKMAASRPLN
jgi:hypothetical protein